MSALKLYSYNGVQYDVGVDMSDVESVYVMVVSGDEVITVVYNDGKSEVFDAEDYGSNRVFNYFDGEYGVHKEDFAKWSQRKSSYDWFETIRSWRNC